MIRLRAVGLVIAALMAGSGLVLIWVARLSADRYLYVSELGAETEPTAAVFRVALTLVAASAAVVALCAPRLTPRIRMLATVSPALVLGVAAVAFGVASQVPCTTYCPLPVGDAFTWQDLVHTVSAVIGFAGASLAMLQLASDPRHRGLARFSLFSAIAVAVIAGVGGLLSLLQFGTQVGGILELIATSIALGWLVGLALFLAAELRRAASTRAADTRAGMTLEGRAAQPQPSQAETPPRAVATYSE